MRRRTTALTTACAILLAACGGSGGDGPDAKETPTPAAVKGITKLQAERVKARTSEARVREILGDPLLTQGPIPNFSGGCLYYPMEGMPVANAWQFCLNERGVKLILTAFSPQQPEPPEDASPVRAALIARADTICQRENARLGPTTDAVGVALQAYAGKPGNPAVRKELDTQMRRFAAIIDDTRVLVGAFEAPEDGRESFDAYVDGLAEQAGRLDRARRAIADDDIDSYEALGEEFTSVGKQTEEHAAEYGFAQCSASTFR